VLLFRAMGALRWNLGHFTDSRRNGVSEGALGSSLGRSFLVPRITYLSCLDKVGSERETGSIESGEDLGGGSWVSGSENGDFRNSQVSRKFACSHFLLKCHLSVQIPSNSCYGVHRNSCVLLCMATSTSGCSRTGILTSW